jgi:hypothetical protein
MLVRIEEFFSPVAGKPRSELGIAPVQRHAFSICDATRNQSYLVLVLARPEHQVLDGFPRVLALLQN